MVWTTDAIKYFLGSDDDFRERYCNDSTIKEHDSYGRRNDLGPLRRVVTRLTALAPRADHASPVWGNGDRSPIVVIGKASIKAKILFNKVGICNIDGDLHFFAEKKVIDAFLESLGDNLTHQERENCSVADTNTWTKWQNSLFYFNTAVTLDSLADNCVIARILNFFNENFTRAENDQPHEKRVNLNEDQNITITALSPKWCKEIRQPVQVHQEGQLGPEVINQENFQMQLNTILYGPPGTGKTFATLGLAFSLFNDSESAKNFANHILHENYPPPPALQHWREWVESYEELVSRGRIEFTTFHQNYAYEDFVEGIRAEVQAKTGSGDQQATASTVTYSTKPGIFKRIAIRALYAWLTHEECPIGEEEKIFNESVLPWLKGGEPPNLEADATEPPPPYLLIIDEINRGNIARILGELITLLEDSKRARRDTEIQLGHQPLRATLPYTQEPFILPPNLYILGTMNTADRSLIGLDLALRRRFSFVELPPRPDALSEDVEGVNLQEFLKKINERIETVLDSDHLIGHAFLMGVSSMADLANAMRQKVIPQLREYFHDRPQDLKKVLEPANGEKCELLKFDVIDNAIRFRGINANNLLAPDRYTAIYNDQNGA